MEGIPDFTEFCKNLVIDNIDLLGGTFRRPYILPLDIVTPDMITRLLDSPDLDARAYLYAWWEEAGQFTSHTWGFEGIPYNLFLDVRLFLYEMIKSGIKCIIRECDHYKPDKEKVMISRPYIDLLKDDVWKIEKVNFKYLINQQF